MEFRSLEKTDYDKGYLSLLEQLAPVGNVTKNHFELSFDKMNSNIFVIEHDNKIIASGTLLIEHKFIHELSCVGHIEDIVVDNDYRSKKLGKKIVEHLVEYARMNNCYKVILNCSSEIKQFYEKIGFYEKNIEMSKYFA
jgi:glucosamine-phosphate N-acetyltransferase